MTFNPHFATNSVLHQSVWGSEAWLSKLGGFLAIAGFLVSFVVIDHQNSHVDDIVRSVYDLHNKSL